MRLVLVSCMLLMLVATSCEDNKDFIVTIHTSMGDMKVLLYDETPLHKKNFLELAGSGKYDSTIWHRVMEGFMIQGGNVFEKEGATETDASRIPAEIVEGFYHTKGTLAAARQPDQVNPERMSSGSQFYIVQGKVFDEAEMTIDQYQLNQGLNQLLSMEKYDTIRQKFIALQQKGGTAEDFNRLAISCVNIVEDEFGTSLRKEVDPEIVQKYTTLGGAPHLDKEYTIFGKVVEGMEVIDKIAAVQIGRANRPVEPLYMSMEVETVPKKEITEKYGYTYSEKK